jgi:voltage-dependent calcium channel T type alpha-1G
MVEYSNMLFALIFLIEMLLKILAYGILGYIENLYNIFDGVIVCISVYEVIKHTVPVAATHIDSGIGGIAAAHPNIIIVEGSGVSVLRTFRLLRILKLVRFMPALRRQLIVMLKTIDNVATFFSLLILFIFIFRYIHIFYFEKNGRFSTVNIL